jgi:hypothetical protein
MTHFILLLAKFKMSGNGLLSLRRADGTLTALDNLSTRKEPCAIYNAVFPAPQRQH